MHQLTAIKMRLQMNGMEIEQSELLHLVKAMVVFKGKAGGVEVMGMRIFLVVGW